MIVRQRGMSVVDFADALAYSRETVHRLFHKSDVNISLLKRDPMYWSMTFFMTFLKTLVSVTLIDTSVAINDTIIVCNVGVL